MSQSLLEGHVRGFKINSTKSKEKFFFPHWLLFHVSPSSLVTVSGFSSLIGYCSRFLFPHCLLFQVYQLLLKANKNRSVAATKCNERSSRSHSVFRLKIEGTNSRNGKTYSSSPFLISTRDNL